ncbi:MAG: diguanylate cyclase [Gammaproteobacteria bacterium]|nr:diguanylate cyclase [Gammaproteobacteria bacterium]
MTIHTVVARWCLVATLAFFAMPATAGEQAASLRFKAYTWQDGLSQNTVTSVAQDPTGYIWLATEDGLHRFDGHDFEIFRAEEGKEESFAQSSFSSILVDRSGEALWLATTSAGIERWDLRTDEFQRFKHSPGSPDSLSDPVITRMYQDSSGAVWVLTYGGVDRIDDGKVTSVSWASEYSPPAPAGEEGAQADSEADPGADAEASADNEPQLSPEELAEQAGHLPSDIVEDGEGRIWLVSSMGLHLHDPETDSFVLVDLADKLPLLGGYPQLFAIEPTPDGGLWLASMGGLFLLDAELEVVKQFSMADFGVDGGLPVYIHELLLSKSGAVWMATLSNGVYWLDKDAERIENYRHDPADPRSISDNYVWDLFEDRTGIIWIGTQSGGVNTFNPVTRAFRHYAARPDSEFALPNRVVWSIQPDSDGNIWVGTDAGFSRLDRETSKYRHYTWDPEDPTSLNYEYGLSARIDSKGQVWLGTGYGVARYREATDDFERFEWQVGEGGDAYYINTINQLFIDAEDNVWTLTYQGLGRIDAKSGELSSIAHDPDKPESTPPSDNLFAVTPSASRGGFWLGTDAGVVHFDPLSSTFGKRYTKADGLSNDEVIGLLESSDGSLWVATVFGVNRIRPDGSITRLGMAAGLNSDLTYGVVEDRRGMIWISTNKGLNELDPVTGAIRQFDVTDGLQSNEFNSGAQYVAEDGEVFFGGINGLSAFYPESIQRRTTPPKVAISKFFKFNEEIARGGPISELNELTVPWSDNVLGFEFSVFDYAAPEKNSYRYRLEGFDTTWLMDRGSPNVTYTNLDPGSYTLRVQGANSSGRWSDEEARLLLHVTPPFWATWWAYSIYVFLVLSSVFAGLAYYRHRVQERHAFAHEQHKRRWAETLQQLTQALTSSLDSEQIAEELLENLRAMVAFRKAVLFMEQGVDIKVAGVKGFTDTERETLRQLPGSFSRFFAEVRHSRKPRVFSPDEDRLQVLREGMSEHSRFLAIPAFSRADEFALLIVGREAPAFSQQEQDIVSAFLTQALVALDNARLFSELQNLSTTDTLTQVNNRRYFFELAELEFNRGKRYDRDVALILLDADNFREINDTYGRDIGDRMLKIIASTCRNNLRHFDIIGRYGGEDFVILLPETPINVAADVADRLRKSIEELRLETHKGELRLTVSVGVAVAGDSVRDLPSLINKADMALYEAKRSGRNQVVVADMTAGRPGSEA